MPKIIWVGEIKPEKINPRAWLHNNINWSNGSLNNPNVSYSMIYLSVDKMFEIFPPDKLLASRNVNSAGQTYILPGNHLPEQKRSGNARGRPPLPWERFSIEVARLFRDDEMPAKKEASILHFQNWFKQHTGKDVSRAAIGQKLKPFYDALVKEGK